MNAALLPLIIAGFSSAALAAQGDPITAHYTCTGGPSLHVVFEDGKATVTPEGGEPIPLTQAVTADGFEYKDATHSLRGRGDDATWTVEGKAIECSAKPATERG
jgi:hypothetical protein